MGAGINEQFSSNPLFNLFYTVTGSVSEVSLPSGTAKLCRFIADPANAGNFLLGSVESLTPVWPLTAGTDTGWCAAPPDMSQLTHSNASGTTDYMHVWIQK